MDNMIKPMIGINDIIDAIINGVNDSLIEKYNSNRLNIRMVNISAFILIFLNRLT